MFLRRSKERSQEKIDYKIAIKDTIKGGDFDKLKKLSKRWFKMLGDKDHEVFEAKVFCGDCLLEVNKQLAKRYYRQALKIMTRSKENNMEVPKGLISIRLEELK